MPDAPRTVDRLLAEAAAAEPDRAVLTMPDRVLTYGEAEEQAARICGGLRARGVVPGDRVVLAFGNADWPGYTAAYFGVLKAGATAFVLSDRVSEAELASVCRQFGVAGVIGSAQRRTPADGSGWWTATAAGLRESDPVGGSSALPEQVAEVQLTSGTTGAPKAVAATHHNLLFPRGRAFHDVLLHGLPIGTSTSQSILVGAVGNRESLVVLPEFTPAALVAAARRHRARWVGLVPAMARWLVRWCETEPRPVVLPEITSVACSSAPFPAAAYPVLRCVFPAADFVNTYTSSEALPARVRTVFDPDRPHSIGRVIGGCEMRVVDAERAPVVGQPGEIELRAASVPGRFYLDDEAATDAVFRDGWVRTGDLGELDDAGYLQIHGRIAETVNVGGFNVSIRRVEDVLETHPGVAEAAVFAVTHELLGEQVAAAVIPVGAGNTHVVDGEALRGFARGQLAAHEVPARIAVIGDFPRTALGKVRKRELAALLAAGETAGGQREPGHREARHDPAAQPGAEHGAWARLASIWCEVLQCAEVNAAADFFAAGGSSLKGVELADKVSKEFGIDVDMVTLYLLPEFSQLAEHVAALVGEPR